MPTVTYVARVYKDKYEIGTDTSIQYHWACEGQGLISWLMWAAALTRGNDGNWFLAVVPKGEKPSRAVIKQEIPRTQGYSGGGTFKLDALTVGISYELKMVEKGGWVFGDSVLATSTPFMIVPKAEQIRNDRESEKRQDDVKAKVKAQERRIGELEKQIKGLKDGKKRRQPESESEEEARSKKKSRSKDGAQSKKDSKNTSSRSGRPKANEYDVLLTITLIAYRVNQEDDYEDRFAFVSFRRKHTVYGGGGRSVTFSDVMRWYREALGRRFYDVCDIDRYEIDSFICENHQGYEFTLRKEPLSDEEEDHDNESDEFSDRLEDFKHSILELEYGPSLDNGKLESEKFHELIRWLKDEQKIPNPWEQFERHRLFEYGQSDEEEEEEEEEEEDEDEEDD